MFLRNFITSTICLFSFISMAQALNDDTSIMILEQAKNSIERMEEEKIFLHADKVFLQDNQLYIEDNLGLGIPIPALYSDTSGLYIKTGSIHVEPNILWVCRTCTRAYKYQPMKCPVCFNETFDVLYQLFQ